MHEILILGGGYVGSALKSYLPNSIQTHRSPEKADLNAGIYFNLSDRDSWNNIPPAKTVIWTFPATPLNLVESFYQCQLQACKNLLVYASTSCYEFSNDQSLVTEQFPLSYAKDRVIGEEFLRKQNAAILVLSGIYGPEREPINWLRKGLIRNFEKIVNLIHRDDIVEITHYLLNKKLLPYGERLNISDGVYRRWSEIANHYEHSTSQVAIKNSANSKLVSNEKLLKLLNEGFVFRSLF